VTRQVNDKSMTSQCASHAIMYSLSRRNICG